MKKTIRFILETGEEKELVIDIFKRLEEYFGDSHDNYWFIVKETYAKIKKEFGITDEDLNK